MATIPHVKPATITVGEASKLSGQTRKRIIERFDAGRIPGFRIGRSRRHILPGPFRDYLVRIGAPAASLELLDRRYTA